jgi:hypothetical protein
MEYSRSLCEELVLAYAAGQRLCFGIILVILFKGPQESNLTLRSEDCSVANSPKKSRKAPNF